MPSFRLKTCTIEATQATERVPVMAPDGPIIAEIGDWIILHADGTTGVMSDTHFHVYYEEVGAEKDNVT
jgi:hypothetical protein